MSPEKDKDLTASLAFEPIQTHRTFEAVTEQIRGKLAAGELRPGDKLPAERDLALRLGVSRSAVREALRSLENAGVLTLRKGVKGGAFIEDGSPKRISEAIQDLVNIEAITLKELTEARLIVLQSVMRLAAERATPDQLDAMQDNIDETARIIDAGLSEERLQIAYEYYHLLAACTQNSAMEYLVDAQTRIVQVHLKRRKWNMPKDTLLKSRQDVLDHLRAGDGDAAAQEIARHLNSLQSTIWED
ncbi:FadR/GntR family transcriptional regulator [Antarctobacter sp.]|uniref:FadR/GntR family transcriptional regulator n=1 Tax=Antarctobacter sp. TaxID=1872577 RepID=UPI003A8EE2EE